MGLGSVSRKADRQGHGRVAIVGNPNAGKTALFNALTGLRARTANYPGITVDVRQGGIRLADQHLSLIDLPGLYSMDSLTAEEQVTAAVLSGKLDTEPVPDLVVLVIDATNVKRNLFLASEILELGRPTIVALNMIDAADQAGFKIDVERLSEQLGCQVIPVSARTGSGLNHLRDAIADRFRDPLSVIGADHPSCTAGCAGCTFAARYDWADRIADESIKTPVAYGQATERIDRFLTRPIVGLIAFLSVMLGLFYLIFSLAGIPMALIEEGFSGVAESVNGLIPGEPDSPLLWRVSTFAFSLAVFALAYRTANMSWTGVTTAVAVVCAGIVSWLPVEDFRSLLIDGVIGGVGGVLVFLPQICILFFFIALLEDSGYLARAAFVMERVMRYVGLPGKAFVPMLSAHACAIPGIMAARVIDNARDRLVTILVLPLLTCSARLPVYGMVAAMLFSDSAALAAAVFLGAYLLGIAAALLTAFCLKLTVLRGETEPLLLELPPYRRPSLRNALLTVFDRGMIFVRKAGTVILLISVILWGLATYPKLPESQWSTGLQQKLVTLAQEGERNPEQAERVAIESDNLVAQEELAFSFAGRMGKAVEPVFRPLGFDWKLNVGVISSFAAREVIVSTLAIIYGVGEDAAENGETLTETLQRQKWPDGTRVYSRATCFSLLVFYVLAMQCLPTQAVTRRETGTWKWAVFQLLYMTGLAYIAAWLTYQVAAGMG